MIPSNWDQSSDKVEETFREGGACFGLYGLKETGGLKHSVAITCWELAF